MTVGNSFTQENKNTHEHWLQYIRIAPKPNWSFPALNHVWTYALWFPLSIKSEHWLQYIGIAPKPNWSFEPRMDMCSLVSCFDKKWNHVWREWFPNWDLDQSIKVLLIDWLMPWRKRPKMWTKKHLSLTVVQFAADANEVLSWRLWCTTLTQTKPTWRFFFSLFWLQSPLVRNTNQFSVSNFDFCNEFKRFVSQRPFAKLTPRVERMRRRRLLISNALFYNHFTTVAVSRDFILLFKTLAMKFKIQNSR